MTTDHHPLEVAVGIIRDTAGRVLVNQRQPGKPFAGQWEFPGGKMNPDETAHDALARELHEELGIRTGRQRPLITLTHDYDTLTVRLHVREVLDWDGEPRSREDQALQWRAPSDLNRVDLLAANAAIVRALVLPRTCLITDTGRYGTARTLARLERHVAAGRALVIVREKSMARGELDEFIASILNICRPGGSIVCVHADCDISRRLPADGTHLPARALDAGIQPDRGGLIGASCHTPAEIKSAVELHADYVLLSPVKRTASHPDATPLGWERFEAVCEKAPLPVYALGGMTLDDLDTAIEHGAQGIAILSAAWDESRHPTRDSSA